VQRLCKLLYGNALRNRSDPQRETLKQNPRVTYLGFATRAFSLFVTRTLFRMGTLESALQAKACVTERGATPIVS